MRSIYFLAVVLVSVAGCAHSEKGERAPKAANQAEVDRVTKRAAVDLNCPEANVTVEVLEVGGLMRPWSFAAKGCDKTATYLSRAGTLIRN